MGLLASFSVVSAPSSSIIALVTLVRNISTIANVLIATLVDTVPIYGVRACNSCNSVWRAANTNYYYHLNFLTASMVTSLTVSPISCKSPSVRVIGFKDVFEALVFFHDTTFSCGRWCLSWVDVVCRSTPPCSIGSSVSASAPGKGEFFPSRSSPHVSYCSANFAVSRTAWVLASASAFLHFSARCAILSFFSSFLRYTVDLSVSTIWGVRRDF